jgi:hypothetical protein
MGCPCPTCQAAVDAVSNDELADWLMARVRRYVPGRTGHDWDERDRLTLIASRLRAICSATATSPQDKA